jgi:DNA mismatch repair protein MSH4
LQNCSPQLIDPIIEMIGEVLNEDALFANSPLELRNQRTYAVKVLSHILVWMTVLL